MLVAIVVTREGHGPRAVRGWSAISITKYRGYVRCSIEHGARWQEQQRPEGEDSGSPRLQLAEAPGWSGRRTRLGWGSQVRNTRRKTKNRRGGFSPNVPRDRVIPELVSRGAQCQCQCGFARARNVRDDARVRTHARLPGTSVASLRSRYGSPSRSPPRPCLLPFTPQPTHRHMAPLAAGAFERTRKYILTDCPHAHRLDRPTPESQAHVSGDGRTRAERGHWLGPRIARANTCGKLNRT